MFSQAQNVPIVAADGNTYANNLGIPGLQVFSITIIRIHLQNRKKPSKFPPLPFPKKQCNAITKTKQT